MLTKNYYRAGGVENNDNEWHFGVGIFAMFFFYLFLSKANGVRNKLLFCGFLFSKNQHVLQEAR